MAGLKQFGVYRDDRGVMVVALGKAQRGASIEDAVEEWSFEVGAELVMYVTPPTDNPELRWLCDGVQNVGAFELEEGA